MNPDCTFLTKDLIPCCHVWYRLRNPKFNHWLVFKGISEIRCLTHVFFGSGTRSLKLFLKVRESTKIPHLSKTEAEFLKSNPGDDDHDQTKRFSNFLNWRLGVVWKV